MDDLQLKYFVKVAEQGNISKTAEKLFISQSSLSQTIRRLEDELGFPLFERSKKRVVLNENGKIFLSCVKEMKLIFSNANEKIKDLNQSKNNKIHLHVNCASCLLPELIRFLQQKMDGISFCISQNDSETIEEDVDISIIGSPDLLISSNDYLLLSEKILLAMPKNHELAKKKKIQIKDLEQESFVGLVDSWLLQKIIKENCKAVGLIPRVSVQLTNPSLMRILLQQNLGIAFVPEKTWKILEDGQELLLRSVEGISMHRNIYLHLNDKKYLSENIKSCIVYMKQFFEGYFS